MAAPRLFVATVPELAREFARRAVEAGARAIGARGRFVLAIPGGSVATAFVPVLAAAPIDWRHVDLFWCDERCAAVDSPESNYGLAQALWLGTTPPGSPRVHRLSGEMPDPDQAAADSDREMELLLGAPPVLDLVLLGVGEDGHVASLFPGHSALEESARWVIAIDDAPKPPACRLTLTLPVLAHARAVCVAAFGASKSETMRAALEDPNSPLPVARVLRHSAEPTVFLDPAASSLLVRGE